MLAALCCSRWCHYPDTGFQSPVIAPLRGTLSKPGTGGYSLWDVLGWEWGMYGDMQVHTYFALQSLVVLP